MRIGGQSVGLDLFSRYTAVYNLLDYPGVVFPTGMRADPELDTPFVRQDFMSTNDKLNHDMCTYFVALRAPKLISVDDSKTYNGAPIGLQLLAYRFDDCKLFAALEKIRGILGLPH